MLTFWVSGLAAATPKHQIRSCICIHRRPVHRGFGVSDASRNMVPLEGAHWAVWVGSLVVTLLHSRYDYCVSAPHLLSCSHPIPQPLPPRSLLIRPSALETRLAPESHDAKSSILSHRHPLLARLPGQAPPRGRLTTPAIAPYPSSLLRLVLQLGPCDH